MKTSWALEDSNFPFIDKLFRSSAFDLNGWEENFVPAMREGFIWHQERSPAFRGHAALAQFDASKIQTLADVEKIPWIFVQNFKERELMSSPPDEIVLTLTSSGTKGQKTRLFLDSTSLNRLRVAAYQVYEALGILRHTQDCNYLLFTYDIEQTPNLGTAWTDVLITEMVPAREIVFLIRKNEKDFEFDLELALDSYTQFARSGKPVRMLGFPAFMYRLAVEIKRRGLPSIEMPQESWVLTGGGWKNHQGETIGKLDFARFIYQTMGIPVANTRDLFGMAEHGVGYVDCEKGQLHVPVYAHAITRDVFSLERNPYGVPGLLQLFSPLQRGYPSISLLTTDEAIVYDGKCECGRFGRRIEYVKRVGLTQHQGCALKALEYLKT